MCVMCASTYYFPANIICHLYWLGYVRLIRNIIIFVITTYKLDHNEKNVTRVKLFCLSGLTTFIETIGLSFF